MYRVSEALLNRILHDLYLQKATEDSRALPQAIIYRIRSANERVEPKMPGYYLVFCIHDVFKGFPCKKCYRNAKEAKHFHREFCALNGISLN